MPNASDPPRTDDDVPEQPTARAADGRPLTAGVVMLATAVAVVGVLVGGLLAAVALTGHVFGAWRSSESLTPGLIGAAMLGTAPGLFALNRVRAWHEARSLVHPLAVVLVGLFTVSLLNAGRCTSPRAAPSSRCSSASAGSSCSARCACAP
ncbi:hypothetical protein ACWCPD_40085 [Streptomyces sp. NPDC001935]